MLQRRLLIVPTVLVVATCSRPELADPLTRPASVVVVGAAAAAPGELRPVTEFDGPFLEFEFPALRIGIAEYEEGPTGTTVFWFPEGVKAVVDVRGGAPGSIDTEGLRLGYEGHFVDAICFAGGASYGLAAATGVSAELLASGAASARWEENLATVPGAIVFDLGARFNSIHPDAALGAAALRAAVSGRFPNGARGAGRSVTQGKYFAEGEWSGQGGAFRQIGPAKLAVFTVVNAMGSVVDRDGRVVRCNHAPADGYGLSIASHFARATELSSDRAAQVAREGPTKNTTITLVVTNVQLRHSQLQRLAVQVHSSMARAIQPFHTQDDGDTLFAVTTDELDAAGLDFADLAVQASEAAWDAVLASVPPATPRPERVAVQLEPAQLERLVGSYEFRPGAVVALTTEAGRLFGESTGAEPVLDFPRGSRIEVFAESATQLFVPNRWDDWFEVRLDSAGEVLGLTLQPGPWSAPARRLPRVDP